MTGASGVNYQCQCSLFKQFTTKARDDLGWDAVSIINVNVLFLSNSQLTERCYAAHCGVNYQCQCSLFKQFTTVEQVGVIFTRVSIINVNVLFLSNSQHSTTVEVQVPRCQLSMSMFSF